MTTRSPLTSPQTTNDYHFGEEKVTEGLTFATTLCTTQWPNDQASAWIFGLNNNINTGAIDDCSILFQASSSYNFGITAGAAALHSNMNIVNKEIVRIERDGRVILGEGVSAEFAATHFWKTAVEIGRQMSKAEQDVLAIREILGAQIHEDVVAVLSGRLGLSSNEEPTIDPFTAYERAKKIIG